MALIVRHSIRVPILTISEVYFARLTPEGISLAEQFGAELTHWRTIGRLFSSPVSRCVDTAIAIRKGARLEEKVRIDDSIGHAHIVPVWNLLPACYPYDPVPSQFGRLLRTVFARPETPGMLDIFVTHDTVVGVLGGYFFCDNVKGPNLPDFLEGVGIWQEDGQIHLAWRGKEKLIPVEIMEEIPLARQAE